MVYGSMIVGNTNDHAAFVSPKCLIRVALHAHTSAHLPTRGKQCINYAIPPPPVQHTHIDHKLHPRSCDAHSVVTSIKNALYINECDSPYLAMALDASSNPVRIFSLAGVALKLHAMRSPPPSPRPVEECAKSAKQATAEHGQPPRLSPATTDTLQGPVPVQQNISGRQVIEVELCCRCYRWCHVCFDNWRSGQPKA